jgi:hypothetical protein
MSFKKPSLSYKLMKVLFENNINHILEPYLTA